MGRQGKEKQLPETITSPRKLFKRKELEGTGVGIKQNQQEKGMLRGPVKYPSQHLLNRFLLFSNLE